MYFYRPAHSGKQKIRQDQPISPPVCRSLSGLWYDPQPQGLHAQAQLYKSDLSHETAEEGQAPEAGKTRHELGSPAGRGVETASGFSWSHTSALYTSRVACAHGLQLKSCRRLLPSAMSLPVTLHRTQGAAWPQQLSLIHI